MPRGVYLRTEKNNNAKGKHWELSAETRQKMSSSKKGKSPKNISLIAGWNKGKTLTPEHIEKLRLAKLGKTRAGNPEKWKHTEATRRKISERVQIAYDEDRLIAWNKGKRGYTTQPCSDERKKNISKAKIGKKQPWCVGENNWNWQGGITPINAKIRNSTEYRDWRIAVFERDNYTCQDCGSRGVTLNADHIKPFAYFPELRLCIDNGRTLCVPCHKKTDTYMGRAVQYKKKLNI